MGYFFLALLDRGLAVEKRRQEVSTSDRTDERGQDARIAVHTLFGRHGIRSRLMFALGWDPDDIPSAD